jgi:phosphoadenosine phosphosulfate reductase
MLRQSLRLLREYEPPGGYFGCFSGGKDSIAIRHLVRMAGVKAHWTYNVTTIDPPEVVRFIREFHPEVHWRHSGRGNFFRRMEEKACIPTRLTRWCCDEYKEQRAPRGSVMLMGIRSEESVAREAWNPVDLHRRTRRQVVLPILDWDSEYLWDFIRGEGLPYPSLYDEGFHRLGCIGCPLVDRRIRLREFARWPGFERRWQLSFQRIWEMKAGSIRPNGQEWFGSACFRDWEEMWRWWNLNLPFPKSELKGDGSHRRLNCFVCNRLITERRHNRVGSLCTMCAGRVLRAGPIHLGAGWRISVRE